MPDAAGRLRLTCVAGARPNFMKVAPILHAAKGPDWLDARLVHTGQHYDERMSDLFEELEIPRPDVHLGVGSASHAVQTGRIMEAFDRVLDDLPTDVVLVVGDVNSTIACALVAVKRGIAVAHVEAGLRSGDRRMPEEINRVLTDQISDYLFTTERTARENLLREGVADEKIHFVGNVMIDTLFRHRERARLQRRRFAVRTDAAAGTPPARFTGRATWTRRRRRPTPCVRSNCWRGACRWCCRFTRERGDDSRPSASWTGWSGRRR